MGNDLSHVLRKADIRSDVDIRNAHYMVNNALERILSTKSDKGYTIVGSGVYNIFIRTSDDEYYRICFRAFEREVIEHKVKTYEVISSDDYGFHVPLEAHITNDCIYYKVHKLDEDPGTITYEELYTLFEKVIKIGQHGLAWGDYHKDNIKRLNGELRIIDFDTWDDKDIEEIIDSTLMKWRLPKDNVDVIWKWAHGSSNFLLVASPHNICAIFAVIHGYTDRYNFMRLRFNLELFQNKYNVHRCLYNRAVYNFLMYTPFGLL